LLGSFQGGLFLMAEKKIFLRGLERSDFPVIINWLKSKDALNNYTFMLTFLPIDKLKDTLVKGLSLALMSVTKKLYLVSEMKDKGIIAFHMIEDIDWRNKTASIQSYFIKEVRNTKIEKDVNSYLSEYLFDSLQLRKVYYYTKIKNVFPELKPEVVFMKHLEIGDDNIDIDVYGFSKKTFESNFT